MRFTVSRHCLMHRCGLPLCSLDNAGQVSLKIAPRLGHRVAAGLVQEKIGQDQGRHGLSDDGTGDDGAHVRALVQPGGGLARSQVNGAQGPGHRRDRFERGAHPHLGAVRDSALDAAGAVGGPRELAGGDRDDPPF